MMIQTPTIGSTPTDSRTVPYSLLKIATLWAVTTLPMVLLAWLAAPALIPHLGLPAAIGYWLVLLPGMMWQLALALWLIRRETGSLDWEVVRQRIGLTTPHHPHTGEQRHRLLWRAAPRFLILTVLFLLEGVLAFAFLFMGIMPGILARSFRGYTQLVDLVNPQLTGRWDVLVLVMLGWLFSAYLSEELFYRGMLLPRMGGKWAWLSNAVLYSLSYLHRPWAIPARFLEAILIARPTQRLRSTWMAVIARSAEGVVLLGLLLGVVTAPRLTPIQANVQFPNIMLHPEPSVWERGSLDAIPHHQDNDANPFAVDLRDYNLASLDLRRSLPDLEYAVFDTETRWPSAEQMPPGFDPTAILETGKNPGLGIRALHQRGITGRGIGIAIIDQPLLIEHQEYASRVMWYEDLFPLRSSEAAMHGPAVASIALGKTVGVAPEADLYYFSVGASVGALDFHYFAQAVRRVLEINQHLPPERQIRVISMSTGWLPQYLGYNDMTDAVAEAEAAGLLVLSVDSGGLSGLGRWPNANPDDFGAYEPGIFWAEDYYTGNWLMKDMLLVPMDSRTVAGPGKLDEYTFGRIGGMSWAVPYLAGVYALAVQASPDITPEPFWALASGTAHTIKVEHEGKTFALGPIIDPVALIAALETE